MARHEGPTAPTDHSNARDNELVFLTLGDGDFTWSLDFARYLAQSTSFHRPKLQFRATGIDTVEELSAKYRHTPFVQREWKRLQSVKSENGTTDHGHLTMELRHGVNAIVRPDTVADWHADVVLFHHPHLGTENAIRHAQFLSHLFHSIVHHWFRPLQSPNSRFFLTLVQGQYQRWKCLEAAHRHGMILIDGPLVFCPHPAVPEFAVPSSPSLTYHHYYEHRRHQTGKSFASRSNGSETYVFGFHTDPTPLPLLLPWFVKPADSESRSTASTAPSFVCTICSKSFAQERSLTNHIKSKHVDSTATDPNVDTRKRPRDVVESVHVCPYCTDDSRTFSRTALQDHITAKHTAIHTSLSPEWVDALVARTPCSESMNHYGACDVCSHEYWTAQDVVDHLNDFVPSAGLVNGGSNDELQCRFCPKSFRQSRALLQHENFCSERPASVKGKMN